VVPISLKILSAGGMTVWLKTQNFVPLSVWNLIGEAKGGVMVNRGRKSTAGELLTPLPTFTESLLMEILIQVIHPDIPDEVIKAILTRAGFTTEEIKERF
jgi:hypothetical protein